MATLTNRLAIGYDNLASGRTIVATTAATGYPASELATARLSERWRSTTGSLTTQNLDADLGLSVDFDLVGLFGINAEDAGTRRVYSDDVSNFATPDHDSTLGNIFDVSIPPLISGRRSWHPFGRHLLYFTQTTQNDRYVRVQISNTGNADNYLRAAVYWVSRVLQLPFDWNWEPGPPVVDGEPGLERVYRTHSFTVRGATTQQKVHIESLFAVVKRTGRCVIVPRPLQKETWQSEALYGVFQGAPRVTRMLASDELWQVTLSFVEVLD